MSNVFVMGNKFAPQCHRLNEMTFQDVVQINDNSKGRISCHLLDISNGQPAGGVLAQTFVLEGKDFKKIAQQ